MTTKKSNKESDKNEQFVLKPKKPTSAWIYFNTATVAKLKIEKKLDQKEAFAKSAEIWKTLSDEDKKPHQEKSKADDESAKRANIVRLRMERETRRKPVKTRRDSKLEKLFGHFEEFAKHEEEHQAEEMDDLAWKEAQDRRIKKKQERLESSRRRRRAENNLGNTGAYTDDHLRSKPQQVDKEVNMAQNVLNSFGGKILKVTGGTDPSSSYFQEMLVRGIILNVLMLLIVQKIFYQENQ